MKILTLGSGSIFAKAYSSSFLIDDTLILDVPNGIVKQLKRLNVDTALIDTCYISHFHADHFFDLPFLLMEMGLFKPRNKPLKIVGPAGIKQKTEALMQLAYPDVAQMVLSACKIEYQELVAPSTLTLANYPASVQSMHHDQTTVNGLSIQAKQTVSFSFDTSYGPAVADMAKCSDLFFIDMSSVESNDFHMGLDSIAQLRHDHPKVRLIATHMSDEVRQKISAYPIEVLTDGQLIRV